MLLLRPELRPRGTEFSFCRLCEVLDILPGGKFRGSWDTPHRAQTAETLPEPSFDAVSMVTLSPLLDNEFCEFITCWRQCNISFHLTYKSSCSCVTSPFLNHQCRDCVNKTRTLSPLCPLGFRGYLKQPLFASASQAEVNTCCLGEGPEHNKCWIVIIEPEDDKSRL